jgi:4-alpha-glucanotransferase
MVKDSSIEYNECKYMSTKRIGTFLPLFSLPHGTIEDGILFLDWLKRTQQNMWQMLPIHQTQLIPGSSTEHVASPYKGYGIGIDARYNSMKAKKRQPTANELELFQLRHSAWLSDYALFCALRDHFGTDNWLTWDEPIRLRNQEALLAWEEKLHDTMHLYVIQQWQLHETYSVLREKAKIQNILLTGDLPFYLPLHSPLVWKYQHIFLINHNGLPRVSGVVNEPKATYGRQVWGHPLYRWQIQALHGDIVALFKLRLDYLAHIFDIVRFDHANGLFLYGSLDPQNEANDQTIAGPGYPIFNHLIHYCRDIGLGIFAEDAAVELKQLRNAMQTLTVPGIRILRYAYDEKNDVFEKDYVRIDTYPQNSVAYTTTHDTETLMGFVSLLSDEQKKRVAEKVGVQFAAEDEQFALHLRQAVIDSPAETVIIPMQDWLLETTRINTPGTENEQDDPNWQYRLQSFKDAKIK